MIGYDENIRFWIYADVLPQAERKTRIPDIDGYQAGNRDVIERNKDYFYYQTKKNGKIEVTGTGYDLLRKIFVLYGIRPDVRLIVDVKDDMKASEDWKTVTNVGVDLSSLDFNDDEGTAAFNVKTGGLLDLLEKRFDDEYDIIPDESVDGTALSALKTVNVRLDARQILKRSRLVIDDGTEIEPVDDSGSTATGLPFKVDYKSESHIVEVLSKNMNSSGGDWATLTSPSGVFILNCPRDITYTVNGKVKIRITQAMPGDFDLDMVFFEGGEDLTYKSKVSLGSTDPAGLGNEIEYTFTDYPLEVLEGESVGIGTLTDSGGPGNIKYEIVETSLILQTDDLYPVTYTKAIRPFDLFDRLVAKIKGKEGLFNSSIFGPGGAYENMLLVHGTWLRGMPEVLNEGEDDERRVQASISLKTAYEAYGILEPLRYDADLVGLSEKFYIGTKKEMYQNFTGVKIGETREKFALIQVADLMYKAMGDMFYGKIKIGSNTSGSEYGEVNNLYSMCGNATWNTINDNSDSVYEATTDVRTGAEDVELQRQKQYSLNPDQDADYDNDWFLLDCKKAGSSYELKKWADYYSQIPTKVYSAATNYNWPFTPARLLLGHGWDIRAGLDNPQYINDSIRFISSNCASSLITKVSGEDALSEDGPIPHSILEAARVAPMSVEFSHPVSQEILDMVRDKDNLKGMVQFKTKGGVEYGRLNKVDTNGDGKWTVVQAKIA